ncbi:hypothetical protein SISSUDRAFT_1038587 [Sistotremastrum suecicum HHB10207 ss-3]|uniref:Uncharacterized protein n=1 Tax=Sistotremastrum suecicum HHB10207 ss-3 TaxID=1314776 RepID=A0A165WJP6_9AGAM|nr:hypothetical protein SISSUDRAFT_1038587 [Sistotremastrum suecicum HHB10207 ss-3]
MGDAEMDREFRGRHMPVQARRDIRRPFWRQRPDEAADADDAQYDDADADADDDDGVAREGFSDDEDADPNYQPVMFGGNHVVGVSFTEASEPDSLFGYNGAEQHGEDDFEIMDDDSEQFTGSGGSGDSSFVPE